MDEVKFLDTYALCEIRVGNPKFKTYLEKKFIINDLILAKFYNVLLKEDTEQEAKQWIDLLRNNSYSVSLNTVLKAIEFRRLHIKKGVSFFDAVGYIFAQENKISFVTGDKEFKEMPGVEFVQK